MPAGSDSPDVAARFPAPAVQYETPGLEPGRVQFSTETELHGWLAALADAARPRSAGAVRLLALGTSEGGRPIEGLLFSHESAPDAATLLRTGRPTALLVGGQHGDEPAPAEALMVVARQLSQGRLNPLLDRINVIVVPRANPDGAAMGARGNAAGADVNRDHLRLATPEAQAIAALLRDYQPAVVADLHEYAPLAPWPAKFGGVPAADVLLQYATTPNLAPFVTRAAEEWFRRPLVDALAREQLRSDWYFTTSDDPADRSVAMGSSVADTLRNVAGLRQAVGLLVESRGVGLGHAEIQRRVHAQVTAVSSVLASAAARAADLLKLRGYVEAEVSAQACQGEVVVAAAPTRSEHNLLLFDVASGADKPIVVDWDSALDLQPKVTRRRPCGYWLAADAAPAVRRLREAGVQVRQLAENASAQGDEYGVAVPGTTTVTALKAAGEPMRHSATPLVTIDALIDMPAGSYYVPLTQPLANLVVAALEPDAPASDVITGVIADAAQVARVRVPPQASFNDVP